MKDPYLNRILVHVGAIALAVASWWAISDFAAALAASLVAFLVVNAIGHLAFGPMPTAADVRRDVESILRRRD